MNFILNYYFQSPYSSNTVYYHNGATFGYKYAKTIKWYHHPTLTIDHIAITPNGALIIIDADKKMTKLTPSEQSATGNTVIDEINGIDVMLLGTASNCLTLDEYAFFGTSDTVYRYYCCSQNEYLL